MPLNYPCSFTCVQLLKISVKLLREIEAGKLLKTIIKIIIIGGFTGSLMSKNTLFKFLCKNSFNFPSHGFHSLIHGFLTHSFNFSNDIM